MRRIEEEIQELLKRYQGDVKKILGEHPRLEYLYALSEQRELLLEWYEFREDARLLQLGAEQGALTRLFCERVAEVTVFDADEDALETVTLRYPLLHNLSCKSGQLSAFAKEYAGQYDYVFLGDGLELPYEEQIEAAKRFLKPDGVLILAVANPLSIKVLAGAKVSGASMTKRRLTALLGGTEECVRYYYPMPDQKTPMSIYSDRYLPKKGDLTRAGAAYDAPAYRVIDQGEKLDAACEEGVFDQYANAYLVFWSAEPNALLMKPEQVYIKYNKTRNEKFQIRTSICEREDSLERYVEKAALQLDGMNHIWSFQEKYRGLSEQNRVIHVAEPTFHEARNAAWFPYLEGETWAEVLGKQIAEGILPNALLREAMEQVFSVSDGYRNPFVYTEGFEEVFGEGLTEEEKNLLAEDVSDKISNIDTLFENLLLTDQGIYCIDYEWVFDFPVPEHFIRYRMLYYFYEQYKTLMQNTNLDQILTAFAITPELETVYRKMEEHFQNYVHGENQKLYLGNYQFADHGPEEIRQNDRELVRARERIRQMKLYDQERDLTIRKMTEVQRLTNNHVTNLETMIADLRHEIEEMGKTLTYLNRHEMLIFKLKRKLSAKFNEAYPKGSLQRKKLSYRKEYLMHPIRSARLYTSAEGKNLKKGDFEIGEVYKQHGKLHFEAVEHPKVSIIIPVYNQIHYTYACLLSILEHTKDVSYEVILADDVSTDATEHITEYVEGLVICRNTTNQGFLRNCNQAARAARGEYVMFLNNDTQVCEGWLSALVTLIESDETIGMVGSKLVYPDGRLQEAGGIIWSDGSGWNYGRLDDPDKPEYNYVKEVDYISGAAILLSNRLWKQIGGFDTRFAPAYCEDSDLAFEVRKAGYRVMYQPLSKVIHFEGISNGTDVEGSGLKRYQVANSKKLKEKWVEEFAKQCVNDGNPDPFRARERSMGKKIILVVDHYVPTYDKDAGSKTTFQYLKMFLKKGYVVKFLGDNFLHEEPYATTLQQMGIEILYGAEYQTGIWDWLRRHGDDIAVAYLNRPHISAKYIDYILEHTDIKVIYYGHDLHFLREGREYQLTGDVTKKENADYWKTIELSLMKKAAMSYYPSYIERDAIHAIDPEIRVKDITAYVFDTFKSDISKDFAKREGLLFVGGFAHPPNADAVLWFTKEVYPRIRQKMETDGKTAPDFYVVGSKVTEEILALQQPDHGIIIKGFVSEEELETLYATCKIVVVPLRYGAGVKGKVVEAIYNGAPIVTTSIGAEGIAQVEDVLCIADEAEQFADAVVRLYQDDAACQALCEKTQTYIQEHFSVDAAWSVIEEDFR